MAPTLPGPTGEHSLEDVSENRLENYQTGYTTFLCHSLTTVTNRARAVHVVGARESF